MMPQEQQFGRVVRERRRALDLTQEELAQRVGCAAVTLRKIEAGDLRPSEQIAERLAMALAVPLEEREQFVRNARAVNPAQRAESPPAAPSTSAVGRQTLDVGSANLREQRVRGYDLAERIGMGGFGAVYRATQAVIEREVAIKIILPQYADHPAFIRRFEAEAQIIARLEHPTIVPLYDYWREPGVAFLVMRYLRGGSLHNLLQHGPLPIERALGLALHVGEALQHAHRAGIIHRDVKPANVLLDQTGNAYLADFGIAKDVAQPLELTFAGAFIGSPAYSSPEQLRAEPLTPQTDIYAFGLLLFELLTGTAPFPGPSTALLIEQHLYARIPLLSERRSGMPTRLDQVVQRAMAKVPSARYPDIAALLADLAPSTAHALAGPVVPTLAAAPATVVLDLSDADNPYKGLRAFTERDAHDFFGRETLAQRLLDRLGENGDLARFLAVLGPSGSGKSSVVRAGLVPALRNGGLPGSEQWYLVELMPGSDPFDALTQAFVAIAPQGVTAEELHDLLLTDQRGLIRALRRVLPADSAIELVLVIDQFEELFTLTPAEQRMRLLDQLVATILDDRSRCRMVITMRADLLAAALLHVDFGELLRQRSELVLPMTPDELERAIIAPARRIGLVFADGLAATILGDLSGQPGALPLLQHALTELYMQRQGRVLTLAGYHTVGGVAGALVRTVETLYAALDPASQAATQQLFLRLIALGQAQEDTRRRVPYDALVGLAAGDTVAPILARFGQARLLSFDRDPLSRAATVEVAHEALLRSWPRLRGWIEASREALQTQRQLEYATHAWHAAGQDASFLATGARLTHFLSLLPPEREQDVVIEGQSSLPEFGPPIVLTADERAYLERSRAAAPPHSRPSSSARPASLSRPNVLPKPNDLPLTGCATL